jgi:phospholipase/carboxylesterase
MPEPRSKSGSESGSEPGPEARAEPGSEPKSKIRQPGTLRGETHVPTPLRGASGTTRIRWRLDSGTGVPDAPLILCLHGMGMNEETFAERLSGLFASPFHFLIPRGPLDLGALPGGQPVRGPEARSEADPRREVRFLREEVRASWYDYEGDPERFLAELRRSDELIRGLIVAVEKSLGLRPRRRYLLGFSQGGYCGGFVALRNSDLFRGMVISGARVKTEVLEEEMRAAAPTGFEVLLCHGRADHSVKPEAAVRSRDALQAAGIAVEHHEFDGGHVLGPAQIDRIREWLGSRGTSQM